MLINDPARGFHLALEKWIANGFLGQQINWALEQLLQRVGETEIPVSILSGRAALPKANKEIQIAAARIECAACRRAKNIQPLNAVALTEFR